MISDRFFPFGSGARAFFAPCARSFEDGDSIHALPKSYLRNL